MHTISYLFILTSFFLLNMLLASRGRSRKRKRGREQGKGRREEGKRRIFLFYEFLFSNCKDSKIFSSNLIISLWHYLLYQL